ncbi:MATE family efflux transporter [Clostridium sp. B9]|uniref:MATE family efflux transporter n=1 Tax=Clostridium sp. B9 TaxID=3423224 RepID=UPI003D2ED432
MIMMAVPITIQSFITSSLNLVDNLMVGKLGEEAIASVGLANQYIFIFTLCILGINAGASVFMSQFWGKKDLKNIKKVLGLDISIGFIVSTVFALGSGFLSNEIMEILSNDPKVIELGARYLQIVAISCIFTNFTQAYSSALRSTEQPSVPMYASLIGVLVNACLNWVFIFGNLGFAEMGVAGAALATTIARFIEMIVIVVFVYLSKNKVAAKVKELMSFDLPFVKTYFKTSWSVIVNELVWSLGMTAYSIAYAMIGTNAVASMQIATTLNNMFMVFLIGLATASSIMIGNKIGSDEEDTAREYAKSIAAISVIVGFILGVLIWITAPLVLMPFNVSDSTYLDTLKVLRVIGLFFTIRAFNMVMIVGVFRGGGDTTYSMLVQSGTIWLYAVPMAFLGSTVFSLPVYSVYFLICTEEFLKLIFELGRLKSGKWIKNVISGIEVEEKNEENLIPV